MKYLRPGDEDGDLVQGPQHRLGAGWCGQAARVAVVLTQVALRQETHQRERLDFNPLSCGRWMWRGHSSVASFAPIVKRNLRSSSSGSEEELWLKKIDLGKLQPGSHMQPVNLACQT